MGLVLAKTPARMSGREFRRFQDGRPDHERWELLGGVPTMMAPPSLVHNRISSNLERLLNDALARHDPSRIAQQRPGLELPGTGDYRPEPDVAVIDSDYRFDQRFVERAYLLAEIVSSSDRVAVPGRQETALDAKRRIYADHLSCVCIVWIEQDRVEILVETRSSDRWIVRTLTDPNAELALPAFGLRCRVGDLYENTPLHRHPER